LVFLLVFQPTVFFGALVGSALNIRSSVGASEPCSVFNVLAISRRRYPFKTTMGLKRQGTSETMRRRAALAFPDLGGLGNPRATGTAHMELTGSVVKMDRCCGFDEIRKRLPKYGSAKTWRET